MNFQDFPAGYFAVNGATFKPPSVPVLLQILSGAQDAASLLPSGSVYSLPRNKVIEISIPGGLNVRDCALDVHSLSLTYPPPFIAPVPSSWPYI